MPKHPPPPGLECADHTIQAEAFGGRLCPDQVLDRNRKLSFLLALNVLGVD